MADQDTTTVLDTTKGVTPEVLTEAKEYGWVPKDKFRGDPKEWVDADEYVKRGRNSIPILRKKLNESETKFRSLSGEVASLKEDMATVRQVGYAQAEAEWKEKFEALKAEKVKALEDDDAPAVVAADEAIAEHKAEKPTPAAKAVELPADQKQWLTDNAWYGPKGDKKLTARANAISIGYAADGLRGVALYEAVKADLIDMFPDDMAEHEGHEPPTRPAPRNGATHRSAGRPPARNTEADERSYENLPADAKEACDRLVKAKQLTVEEYVKHYQGWK